MGTANNVVREARHNRVDQVRDRRADCWREADSPFDPHSDSVLLAPVELNGQLSEPSWHSVQVASDFRQREARIRINRQLILSRRKRWPTHGHDPD